MTKVSEKTAKKSRTNFGATNMLTTTVLLLSILNKVEAQSPTASPTLSSLPSLLPSDIPSDTPSDQPSQLPSSIPSDIPSGE